MSALIIKELTTGKEIHRVPISNPFLIVRGQYKYQLAMMGILHTMDTDKFYIDDSEFDEEV